MVLYTHNNTLFILTLRNYCIHIPLILYLYYYYIRLLYRIWTSWYISVCIYILEYIISSTCWNLHTVFYHISWHISHPLYVSIQVFYIHSEKHYIICVFISVFWCICWDILYPICLYTEFYIHLEIHYILHTIMGTITHYVCICERYI